MLDCRGMGRHRRRAGTETQLRAEISDQTSSSRIHGNARPAIHNPYSCSEHHLCGHRLAHELKVILYSYEASLSECLCDVLGRD